ncbi:hypothetical protein HN371_19370 [Candidatus Poribacteria bacterium]|nr:hypothetical protein [Candidatus Poribacteria bacterium]MBT5712743.1 hypothetical protein [Candidatus Poribacteria bacterium]MBT7098035.1 hypothetical protein [Candidatus Poribacteria bacterium]MBT7804348.1 hypothetical protein [Candidatus Poribacteria bacterium]
MSYARCRACVRPAEARNIPIHLPTFIVVVAAMSLFEGATAFASDRDDTREVHVMDFVHPGALNSKAELDFVKAQIQAGAQPWKDEFDQAASSSYATQHPHGLTNIDSEDDDANVSRDDAIASYAQALLWYFTGDEAYAERSIAILNSWSRLQSFTGGSEQDRLQAGWIGAVFAPAAEIMRGYPGWAAGDIENLQAMFRTAFYPQLNTASFWNGNVDLTQIDAMMAIAVFNEDGAEFTAGIERLRTRSRGYFYLTSDGARPEPIAGDGGDPQAFWSNPTQWVDGLTQETCRDNGHHAQYALGSALHAAEVAWHQGVDVYTEHQERYTAAMELMATQLLTGSMQGVCSDDVSTRSRYDTWEVGYNHYHNRVGVALPNTRKLILEQIRPEAPRAVWNLAYETLTHGDLPSDLSAH